MKDIGDDSRFFIIDGLPRCGSTSIMRVVNLHPEIKCCMEPFHPRRFGGAYLKSCIETGSVDAAVDALKLAWNGIKHVWEPAGSWPFVECPSLNEKLLLKASAVVSVRRRNLLRQYVSAHVCRHISYWVGDKASFDERVDRSYLPPLLIDVVVKALKAMKAACRKRDELIAAAGMESTTLYYEDMFEDPVAFFRISEQIFTFLDKSLVMDGIMKSRMQDLYDPEQHKWIDENIYERIPGAIQIDAALSDEWGKLFE